jgi:hypothetical protein
MGRGEEREKEGRKNWGNNQVSVHWTLSRMFCVAGEGIFSIFSTLFSPLSFFFLHEKMKLLSDLCSHLPIGGLCTSPLRAELSHWHLLIYTANARIVVNLASFPPLWIAVKRRKEHIL